MTKKIEFTDRAQQQINKMITEDHLKKFFRISVKGGGCSGFKYNFSFDDKTDNEVDAIAGATITGDGVSAMLRNDLRLYVPYFKTLKK